MKKLFILIGISLILTSCQRGCTKMSRAVEVGDRNYSIIMFSGGDTVFVDHFRGMVNNSESSDGIYYFKGDKLIEVSGDYVITSDDEEFVPSYTIKPN